jgi:hypothetical protein
MVFKGLRETAYFPNILKKTSLRTVAAEAQPKG